jgi:hypothetical protein
MPICSFRRKQMDGAIYSALDDLGSPVMQLAACRLFSFPAGHILDMLLTSCGLTAFSSHGKVSKAGWKDAFCPSLGSFSSHEYYQQHYECRQHSSN